MCVDLLGIRNIDSCVTRVRGERGWGALFLGLL